MYCEISMVVSSPPAWISSDFAPHMAELVLRERCEQVPLVFLADRELRAVKHLDAVILEPQNGAHVDDDAAVADQNLDRCKAPFPPARRFPLRGIRPHRS